MFDPSEIPETKSKFALHVVRHDREIIIQKIPLLEVTDDTIGENILEPFIEPVGNHHAYLVNGRLKVSRKFPKAITDTKHRKNNIHLYFEFTSSRFTKNFKNSSLSDKVQVAILPDVNNGTKILTHFTHNIKLESFLVS